MTKHTIKHLRSQTSSMVFDCLFVDRNDGNSDTFVFVVTDRWSESPRPKQAIMEIVGNWELYELLAQFKKFDEARPLENGQGLKMVQDIEESGVPDADMSVSLKRDDDAWTLDVAFNPEGAQDSFAASHGGDQDYKDTDPQKPFFHVEFNNEKDVYDVLRFLRDPFYAPQIAEYPLQGHKLSIADTYQELVERFSGDDANHHLAKAMETFMERVKKADL